MTDNVKIIDVNKIGKSEGGKLMNIFKSFKENPLSLARIAGFLIVMGAIIGLLTNSSDDSDNLSEPSPTVTTVTKDAPPAPIINPKFGTSYSGGGGLDKLYDDLGGTDPLKNGKLDATIDVDTDKYSCKFNVKYEGENKKMIECLSGCYNEDENSEFCEGYIYNDQIDGGKRLSDLYDDAGGNENARSGQYNAIINVSSGAYYDKEADTSCGFSVEYVGNNKRSVSCTAGWCDKDDTNYDKCSPYEYKGRNENEHGTKGDTLLDDTYVSRRGVLEDFTKPSEKQCESNEDCSDNKKCDSNICVVECESNEDCPSGNCVDKACKPEGGDNSIKKSSKSNYFYSLLYVILGIPTLILLTTRDTPMQRSIILFIFGLVCTIIIPAWAFGYNFGKNLGMFATNITVISLIVLSQLLFMHKRIDPLSWKWIILHVLYIVYYVFNAWFINNVILPFGKKD